MRRNRPVKVNGILFFILILFTACRNTSSSEFLLKAGDALREGKVEEALSYYNRAAERSPNSPTSQEALYFIGRVHRLFKKQPKEALFFFRGAVYQGNMTPYCEKAQETIADIYYSDLKDYKKAIVEFQKLVNQFPGSKLLAEAQFQIAQCYMALGDDEQAEMEYSALLDRYGAGEYRDAAAYWICVIHFRQGKFAEARKGFENFIALYGDSPLAANAKLGLADTLEEMGETEEAVSVLGSLEKDYPNKEIILRKVDNLLKKKAVRPGVKSKG